MFVGSTRGRLGDYLTQSPVSTEKVILGNIPGGTAGTVETLKIMRQLARDAVRNPDQIVRTKARDLLMGLPTRAYRKEVQTLQNYVRDAVRYLRDPVSVELVQTPEKTLEYMQGDCDDKATLLAALLDSVGHPARFAALGFNGDNFSHVLVETRVGDKWIPLETILPDKEPGWYPQGVTKRYVMAV